MNIRYIDIHSHLNFPDYDADLEKVLADMAEKGVATIVVGTVRATSVRAVELAEKYPHVWAIVGLHPIHAHEPGEIFDYEFYKKLAVHPRVVGIGECGFDYFHCGEAERAEQERAFCGQIQLANEVGKPLMLHLRNAKKPKAGVAAESVDPTSTRDAYEDALAILEKKAKVKGDAHFYAGTIEQMQRFLKLGFGISFNGVITFARDYDALVRAVPEDMLMSETDAPFVAPNPHRGKRNQPDYVIHAVNKMAEIRGVSPADLELKLVANARRLFGI